MDIECFGALDALFAGHSLVLQAQSPALVNNGQVGNNLTHAALCGGGRLE